MYDDNFSPEQIERLPDALPGEDARLVSDLQAVYQPLAESHTRSLERVWARLAQEETLARISLPTQWKQPEGKLTTKKELNSMENKNVSWGTNFSTPLPQEKRHGSILHLLGIGLVAAAAIFTILSFTIFSGVLRSALQTASKGSSTLAGAQSRQLNAISSGKLVCSVGLNVRPLPPFRYDITRVNWSTQGKIAVSSIQNSTIFSAKDCSAKSTKPTTVYEESWSPDGKKLVTANASSNALDVLDSNGNSIANIPFTRLGATSVGSLIWSSDGTKLIFISVESDYQSSIKSVDAATGDNVKTLMKIPDNKSGFTDLSPDGKYVIITQVNIAKKQKNHSVWDVSTGKKMSDLPSDGGKGDFGRTAFSPDGSLIAVGGNMVHIYTTATGNLLTTFEDHDAVTAHSVGALAWSPDGKYLAESANSINIYDVNAKKIVTTFGKVDAHHQIFGLAWAPDDNGLVSSTNQVSDDGHSQTPVNVWALS